MFDNISVMYLVILIFKCKGKDYYLIILVEKLIQPSSFKSIFLYINISVKYEVKKYHL